MSEANVSEGKQVVIVDAKSNWGDDFAVERAVWEPLGAHLTVAQCQTEEEIMDVAKDADVVVYMGLYTPFTRRVIEALPHCRMIIRYGIGVDTVDIDAATDHGIIVGNAAEYCVIEVADHACALLLTLARRVVSLDRFVRSGGWTGWVEVSGPVQRLSALTLGLVGFGRIARQVAHKMTPFVGTILTHDPYISPDAADSLHVQLVEFEELLERSDLVSVHTPLTPATRHLISGPQLARMKASAFLVNTSRGPVVDEQALIKALQNKEIAGAALDVAEVEPLSPDSPLRSLDNVVLTPHSAHFSLEAGQEQRASVAQSVADVVQGYWPRYVVNPSVQPRFPLKPRSEA